MNIGTQTTEKATGCTAINTGNDLLILHEIKHALTQLLATNEATVIDLRAIPMAPHEEEKIEAMLGEGEVSIHLKALGTSTLQETAIAGVWLITHYNAEKEILSKFIEITRIPSLVASPIADIENGLQQLKTQLKDDA